MQFCNLTYCLEKRTCSETENPVQGNWKPYAICAKRALLERVRMGQAHPEHWRITLSCACKDACIGTEYAHIHPDGMAIA